MSTCRGLILSGFMALLLIAGCQKKGTEPPPLKFWDLTGRVINLSDNSPIIGAKVHFAGDSAVTDSIGSYGFKGVPEGTFLISVKAENYREYEDSIYLFHEMTYNVPLTGFVNLFGQASSVANDYIKGAIVSVGNAYDTTDDSGYYALSLIQMGVMAIICHHPDYFSYVDTLHFAPGQWRLDIKMGAKPNDTLPSDSSYISDSIQITEDATVQLIQVGYFAIEDDSNYGQSSILWVSYDLWLEDLDPTQPDPTIPHLTLDRFFLKLPALPREIGGTDSVILALYVIGVMDYGQRPRMAVVRNNWSENEITWATQPAVTDAGRILTLKSDSRLYIDVTDIYKEEGQSQLSLAFSISVDFPGMYGAGIASSEYPELDKRPYVELRYKH